jgi:Zn-dependent metalloprotease
MYLPQILGLSLLSILLSTSALAAPASTDAIHQGSLDESEAIARAIDHLQRSSFPDAQSAVHSAELDTRLVVPWAAGTRVRIAQKVEGIDVLGSELIVSLDRSGEVQQSFGEPVYPGPISTTPTLPAEEATRRARGFLEMIGKGTGELWPARQSLRFSQSEGELTLCWLVSVSFTEPLGTFDVLVGAHDGQLLGYRTTLFEALGNAYPSNPEVSDLGEVELLGLVPGSDTLNGGNAIARTCDNFDGNECLAKSQIAMADENGNFLFNPNPTSSDDPLAEVQMYYHLDLVARWFEDTQGFTHPFPTEGLVNFDYNNAVFGDVDGDGLGEVAFGQTSSIDFAYDADVIYHEFGHSVFGRIAGQTGFIGADEYGMEWATGGLNEGTADLFSLVLTEDPKLGEYAGSGGFGSAAIRDLEEDRHCPTDLYGEVHRDGEIFGSFGWNLIEQPTIGAQLTGDFIYGAVAAFPPDANWAEAGVALVTTAQEMLDSGAINDDQHAIITAELEKSGLADCGRVIRLDEGQEPSQFMVGVSAFVDQLLPIGQQFSLDAPEGTYKLRFRVKDFLTSDANLGWTIFVRRGAHIVHELEAITTPFGEIDIPTPSEFDFSVDGSGDDFELIIDDESELILEPGETYFFSIASRQNGALSGFFVNAEITVDGDAYIDEVPGDDNDDNGEDDNGDGTGCACSSSSLSPAGAGSGIVGLLFLLAWRRGRTQL